MIDERRRAVRPVCDLLPDEPFGVLDQGVDQPREPGRL